jgi:hypothetical protein
MIFSTSDTVYGIADYGNGGFNIYFSPCVYKKSFLGLYNNKQAIGCCDYFVGS